MKSKQKGYSLVEIGIGMVVVVFILAGVVSMGKDVMDAGKINTATNAVSLLRTAASRYGAPSDFEHMTLATITVSNTISDGIGTNPWGGDYSITVNNNGADYTLVLTEVPEYASGPLKKAFSPGASTAVTYADTTLTVSYDE